MGDLWIQVVPASEQDAPALAVDPYGTNDAGGFRNVLPPGSNGNSAGGILVSGASGKPG